MAAEYTTGLWRILFGARLDADERGWTWINLEAIKSVGGADENRHPIPRLSAWPSESPGSSSQSERVFPPTQPVPRGLTLSSHIEVHLSFWRASTGTLAVNNVQCAIAWTEA